MMELCEVQDFTIKDLMAPTPNRLKRHMSGVINFCKFREERLILLQNLSSTREELLENMNNLRNNNEKLMNRLSLLKDQTCEESDMIHRLEVECADMEENMRTLDEEQVAIREETEELNTKNEVLKSNIATIGDQVNESTMIKNKLSKQIVNNPEKFRKQIMEVGQTLQNELKGTS